MLNKHNISADVRYVLIQKFLSIENEFSFKDSFILNSYFTILNLGQSDKKAFGLEMGDTAIERIPLVVSPVINVPLKRITHA
jgi:KUP system potassium uptake protein